MKKIFLYILILVVLTFCIPTFFTRGSVESSRIEIISADDLNGSNMQDESNKQSKIENSSSYDYKNFNTIKLLHTKTNTIEEIPLDEYLYGVVSAEMPVDFNMEALKAQAIVARTYTIYKILENQAKHGDADICDDSACCQAWISKDDRMTRWEESKREENWEKIVEAVNETSGKVITYQGRPINAFFHSNSGGTTEAPVNVWGGTGYPYLQSVETSGEDAYSQYNSELEISKEDFINKIKEKYSDFEINFDDAECVKILEYTDGGRIRTVKIGNHNLSGVEVRTIFALKSANFTVEIGETIKFKVIGYGHGVGMSQTGADSLANQGYSYEQIIKHFYTGVEISNW